MPHVLSWRQGRTDIEEQVQMVGHDGGLPKFYLGIEAVYLRQFLFYNGMTKGAESNMGEGF
jgi:hypothetical protein